MSRSGSPRLLRFAPILRCIGCGGRLRTRALWCQACTPPPAPNADLVRLLFACRDCPDPLAWGRNGVRHVLLDGGATIVGSLRTGHRAVLGGRFAHPSHALERGR